ncbi:dihydrofolate reductase [Phanerochaete sordida]|uniref:Dihydrofolate reductase n=1 Tax=Phanerochaete sordida TaxID=48140 RepID=A0A9P3FZJ9_9APHY|nr:dihydrofolate reductase [Phanerochaete sordida]
MTRLTVIVAATVSNGIGQSSRLPWRLPQEMAYFARVTSNALEGTKNAVVMGRKTWESIPTKFRPLKDRMNVVISRNQDYQLQPTSPLTRLSAGLAAALTELESQQSEPEKTKVNRIFIIGGATLYKETLELSPSSPAFVDRVLLTRILSPSFDECDVFLPDFLQAEGDTTAKWSRCTHEQLESWVGFEVPRGVQEEKGVQYEFQMWTR